MKKLLAFVLSLAMLLSFAACGDDEKGGDGAERDNIERVEVDLPDYVVSNAKSLISQTYNVKIDNVMGEHKFHRDDNTYYIVSAEIVEAEDAEYVNGYAVAMLFARDGDVYGASNDSIFKNSEKELFDKEIDELIIKSKKD